MLQYNIYLFFFLWLRGGDVLWTFLGFLIHHGWDGMPVIHVVATISVGRGDVFLLASGGH